MSQFCTNFSTFIVSKLAIPILPFTVKIEWCLSCYSLHVQDCTVRLQDLLKGLLIILKSSFVTILIFSGHFTFPLSLQITEPHYLLTALITRIVIIEVVLFLFTQNMNPMALCNTATQLYLKPSLNLNSFSFE